MNQPCNRNQVGGYLRLFDVSFALVHVFEAGFIEKVSCPPADLVVNVRHVPVEAAIASG